MSMNDIVDTYLAVRRACGFKLKDEETCLRSFAKFADDQGDTHVVARKAIMWAEQSSTEHQRAIRLQAVIRLARFSLAEDNRHEIPPEGFFCSRYRRPMPYLFNAHEVQALMEQAERLGPVGSIRPHTFYTLIGLLSATGLRISEALGLHFQDVTPDGLLIRKTKFRKTRLVPIDPSTRAALNLYLEKRCRLATDDDHLFLSLSLRPLSRDTACQTFVKLLVAVGLHHQSGRRRPRLIDFRHSFASKVLLNCSEDRERVGRNTLALMTYMGHAHPSSTYWYLEQSPRLMGDIAKACEHLIEKETMT